MRKRVAVIIVLILLIVISLVAYYAWLSPIPSGIPSSERGESQETVKFIEVVDALGRTVKIRAPINKVIITGRGSWPIVTVAYMFPNAKKVLYGLSPSLNSTLFQAIDPNISDKIVSAELNVEEISKAKPDVVILKTTMKSLGGQLEELGISVVYVDLENLESYVRDLKVLGKIFMDDKRGEELARYYSERVNSIASRVPLSAERPKVLFLYYSVKGGEVAFNVPGSGWLQTFLVETAGGYPLSKETPGTGWNTVTFEQIARWGPDIIFIVTYSTKPSPSEVKESLLMDPMWGDIPAIKSRMIYAVPDDCNVSALGSWDTPGSRWILGLMWMAKKIHPDIFNNLDIREEAKKFYIEIYGLSQQDAEKIIDHIAGDFP
ncbi:MAG: ABC transporter substrate-binding protein [Candidatus Bathyarchaeia archaeon]|nr:ABC transporter substrate-binding protein [Candidatus Bathyarchaeota archaeon]